MSTWLCFCRNLRWITRRNICLYRVGLSPSAFPLFFLRLNGRVKILASSKIWANDIVLNSSRSTDSSAKKTFCIVHFLEHISKRANFREGSLRLFLLVRVKGREASGYLSLVMSSSLVFLSSTDGIVELSLRLNCSTCLVFHTNLRKLVKLRWKFHRPYFNLYRR